MYAIIATGGKQYKVAEGDVIRELNVFDCASPLAITLGL